MSSKTRATTVALVTMLVVGTAVVPAVASAHEAPHRSFVVDLAADGSADVTVTMTFDLESESERDAFRQLRENESVREALRTTFRDRMERVASAAANRTGREMAIRDAAVDVRTVENTGVVELSVTWEGLAAVEGDRLVVTEPFASGFEPERPFRLVAPDGYEPAGVSPTPDARENGTLSWESGTSLEGLEATFAPVETAGTTTAPATDGEATTASKTAAGTTAGEGAGFGIGLAVLAALAAGLIATRVRS